GTVGDREPRWAIARKFAPEVRVTKLKEIRINVGRTGALNPYAVLEPVEIGGVTVSTATLHNFALIKAKDIREGDLVEVTRAGEGAARRRPHQGRRGPLRDHADAAADARRVRREVGPAARRRDRGLQTTAALDADLRPRDPARRRAGGEAPGPPLRDDESAGQGIRRRDQPDPRRGAGHRGGRGRVLRRAEKPEAARAAREAGTQYEGAGRGRGEGAAGGAGLRDHGDAAVPVPR